MEIDEAVALIEFAEQEYPDIYFMFCQEILEPGENVDEFNENELIKFAQELKFEHRFIWKEM